MLLILDNCEHVIDEVRRVAAGILRGGAGGTFWQPVAKI